MVGERTTTTAATANLTRTVELPTIGLRMTQSRRRPLMPLPTDRHAANVPTRHPTRVLSPQRTTLPTPPSLAQRASARFYKLVSNTGDAIHRRPLQIYQVRALYINLNNT